MMGKRKLVVLASLLGLAASAGCIVGGPDAPPEEVQDGLSPEEAVPVEDESIPVDESGNEPTEPTSDVEITTIASAYPAVALASSVVSHELVKDGSYIYFTTVDALMRVPTWGGTPTKMVGSLSNARGLAIDSSNLYWAEYGTSATYCTIKKMPKIGGTITRLYAGPYGCAGLAINGTSVFWTNYAQGSVGSINKGGSGLKVRQVGGRPRELEVDSDGNMWWTNESRGTIEQSSEFVSDADLRYTDGIYTTLASNQAPTHLVLSGDYVYWTNYDHGTISRANLSRAGATKLVVGQAGPIGLDIAGGMLYWTNAITGKMMKSRLDGTYKSTVATVSIGATKLLVRYRASRTPPSLYWVNPTTKKVMKIDQY